MPKVSVIVPVYKAEAFIEMCARSLFGQTLDDMEYIFVDDCSPDRSIEILKTILRDYPSRENQVKIITLEKNSGVAKAREIGLSAITGEFFIYCDSDDYVDFDAYEKMYLTAVHEQSDVVVCDVEWILSSETSTQAGVISETKEDILLDMLQYKIPVALWNKLFAKRVAEDIVFSKFGFGEDLVMAVQMLNSSNKISYRSDVYYHYLQNCNSITHNDSAESRVDKFKAMVYNLAIIRSCVNNKDNSIRRSLYYCQYYSKKNLIYKISSTNFKAWWQWLVSFPSLTFHLKEISVPIKDRLFFYFAYIGFTPYSSLYKIIKSKRK